GRSRQLVGGAGEFASADRSGCGVIEQGKGCRGRARISRLSEIARGNCYHPRAGLRNSVIALRECAKQQRDAGSVATARKKRHPCQLGRRSRRRTAAATEPASLCTMFLRNGVKKRIMTDTIDWQPIWLTLRLASLTTLVLMVLAIPLGWWLARTTSWIKQPLSALLAMPLVLPPTVLGFYLLLLLGPHGSIGQFTQWLGIGTLPFTFTGLVIASC